MAASTSRRSVVVLPGLVSREPGRRPRTTATAVAGGAGAWLHFSGDGRRRRGGRSGRLPLRVGAADPLGDLRDPDQLVGIDVEDLQAVDRLDLVDGRDDGGEHGEPDGAAPGGSQTWVTDEEDGWCLRCRRRLGSPRPLGTPDPQPSRVGHAPASDGRLGVRWKASAGPRGQPRSTRPRRAVGARARRGRWATRTPCVGVTTHGGGGDLTTGGCGGRSAGQAQRGFSGVGWCVGRRRGRASASLRGGCGRGS